MATETARKDAAVLTGDECSMGEACETLLFNREKYNEEIMGLVDTRSDPGRCWMCKTPSEPKKKAK